jgi:hypothetical protein
VNVVMNLLCNWRLLRKGSVPWSQSVAVTFRTRVCLRRTRLTINMDLVEVRWGGVDWIGLAHDRYKWRALVNMIIYLHIP